MKYSFFYFSVHQYFVCMSVCVPCACLEHMKARSKYKILWDRSYRHLCATMWVLEIEFGSFGRVSSDLNSWAISLQPQSLLNWGCMLLVRTSLWESFNHCDSRIVHSFTKHWAHTVCIKCWVVVLSSRDSAMVLQCPGKTVGWCQSTMKHLNNERSEKRQQPATSIAQVTFSIRISSECNNFVFSNHVLISCI